jgi:transketolase
MRKELCAALVDISANPNMLFLTGDLGFMALEPLQAHMGTRFINAGVAEQNMISVAAALAKDNWDVWCYSIAPFCVARPFEQIRNDVCLHNMPVRLIGNGGGYGYGVMAPPIMQSMTMRCCWHYPTCMSISLVSMTMFRQ